MSPIAPILGFERPGIPFELPPLRPCTIDLSQPLGCDAIGELPPLSFTNRSKTDMRARDQEEDDAVDRVVALMRQCKLSPEQTLVAVRRHLGAEAEDDVDPDERDRAERAKAAVAFDAAHERSMAERFPHFAHIRGG